MRIELDSEQLKHYTNMNYIQGHVALITQLCSFDARVQVEK